MFTWAIIDDARDRHTAPGIARRSRLASRNCGTQPWGPAAKCEVISARALTCAGAHPKHMRGTSGENLRRNSALFLELMQTADSARIKVTPTLRNSLVFPTGRVD